MYNKIKNMKKTWFDISWKDYQLSQNLDPLEKLKLLSGIEIENLSIEEYNKFLSEDNYWDNPIPTVNPLFIELENGEIVSPIDLYTMSVAEYEDCSTYLREQNFAGVMSIMYRPVNPNLWDRIKIKALLKSLKNAYKTQDKDKITKYITKLASMKYTIEKYDYNKTDARIEYFNNLAVPYIYSASIFFCLQSLNSKKISNYFSQIIQQGKETD